MMLAISQVVWAMFTYATKQMVLEVEFDVRSVLLDNLENLDGLGGDLDRHTVSFFCQ